MKKIPLSQGKSALVDDADYEELIKHKWCAWHTNGSWYAHRGFRIRRGHRGTLRMHRVILNAPQGLQVDHIDGDGLNNQRSNLRLATRLLNQRNQYRRNPTRVGLPMGVRHQSHSTRYAAQIHIDGKGITIGTYDTIEEAHAVYLTTRKKSIAAAIAEMNNLQEGE